MFQTLKKKIKDETGQEISEINQQIMRNPLKINRNSRNSSNSISSLSLDESAVEQKDTENNKLKLLLASLENDKKILDKENRLLEESCKLGQLQKEMLQDEQDKIHNLQHQEINKLKSMLMFREEEAVASSQKNKAIELQIENLKNEILRIQKFESNYEDLKDELETIRRTSQLEKHQLTIQLSAKEEETKHLKIKLEILESSRTLLSDSTDNDKISLLLYERKLLETRLEEAHLGLIDVKSNWSSQNMSLETQLQRLSRQLTEETGEKRKAIEARENLQEKIKLLEFDLLKSNDELKQRDNKIKLLSEEIDELSTSLRELRNETEEEIEYLRNKKEHQTNEITKLKDEVKGYAIKLTDLSSKSDKQMLAFEIENQELRNELNSERQEKISLQLKNAEISQSHENIKIQLRDEQEEANELTDRLKSMEIELEKKIVDMAEMNIKLNELNDAYKYSTELQTQIDRQNMEATEKNKAIKILNQRLIDMKKTLQEEIKSSNSGTIGSLGCNSPAILTPTNYDNNNLISLQTTTMALSSRKCGNNNISGPVVMDEVNFRYLKHVILKFLTSRELEAKHLIRAVSTLLHLSPEEEKLIADTLNWKTSWFGAKPEFSLASS